MTSSSEAELEALFIAAKEIISNQHTLSEMGWNQLPSLLQTNNSTAEGIVNNIIVLQKN